MSLSPEQPHLVSPVLQFKKALQHGQDGFMSQSPEQPHLVSPFLQSKKALQHDQGGFMGLSPEQPHLVSLVLQSKKALQHGQLTCSHAHTRSNATAKAAIDALALDAKVRWTSEAVTEQLKLAASVAKCIEEKRAHLNKQVQAWDATRSHYTDDLENILESLGSRLVPPEFHQISTDSSLFGSQHSEQEPKAHDQASGHALPPSPSATLRHHQSVLAGNCSSNNRQTDRTHWKNLRDFVDDQAIEDNLETIEDNRTALDKLLARTDDYPETLTGAITSIRSSLPELNVAPSLVESVHDTLTDQDTVATNMARSLESLASHYEQMDKALKETEAGEVFGDEDLQQMLRDVEELPAILSELEESARQIDGYHAFLLTTLESSNSDLVHLNSVLNDLEELGDIMGEMLRTQEEVERKCEEELHSLHEQILTIRDLHEQYVAYQTAFNNLVLEMARRRAYKEAVETFVKAKMSELTDLPREEDQVRRSFNTKYGASLPEDICLCIGNSPTRWKIVPWPEDTLEVLPHIDDDILAEAMQSLNDPKD